VAKSSYCFIALPVYRSVRRSRGGNGEAVLPEVSGRLCAQVVETPPHRWRILWHWLSTHAVHGSPWVQTETPRQPVHRTVSCSYWYMEYFWC